MLGATGSIGKNTLDVVRASPGDFEPVLLGANRNESALRALQNEFPGALSLLGADRDDLRKALADCRPDIVVNGVAGAAGLFASIAALEAGSDLALANKESVVMAWRLIRDLARANGAKIIPVDSEHGAVFNLINAHCADRTRLAEIILTASGGPFRNFSAEELERVTVKDALAHPTWDMGAKITIDSASLANKGLEVIEAVRLFDTEPEAVRVTIHPQSVVHSMVRLRSGTVYAEMSRPDMRVPIHNALYYPECVPCRFARLDTDSPADAPLNLSFYAPDPERFPMLPLAYEAVRAGELFTVAYNAANEEAVSLFREGKIRWPEIPKRVKIALDSCRAGNADSLEIITEADRKARAAAQSL